MTGPVDRGERGPVRDWRAEVNWPRVRRLTFLHALYWVFGAAQVALYNAGVLAGALRLILGVLDYMTWCVLLVLLWPVVTRARDAHGGRIRVHPRTFLVLVAFMASLAAYLLLLDLIGLGTVVLLP